MIQAKWLYENYGENIIITEEKIRTIYKFDGDFALSLYKNNSLLASKKIDRLFLKYGVTSNNTNIVQDFLPNNLTDHQTSNIIHNIKSIEMLKFLCDNIHFEIKDHIMVLLLKYCCKFGNKEDILWLHTKYNYNLESCKRRILCSSLRSRKTDLVNWILTYNFTEDDFKLCFLHCCYKDLETVNYLLTFRPEAVKYFTDCTNSNSIIRNICKRGNKYVFFKIRELNPDFKILFDHFVWSCYSTNLEFVKELYDQCIDRQTDLRKAFTMANSSNNTEVLKYLMEINEEPFDYKEHYNNMEKRTSDVLLKFYEKI